MKNSKMFQFDPNRSVTDKELNTAGQEIQKLLKKMCSHAIVEVGSRKKRPALNSCFKSLLIWWVGNERNGYYRSMICSAISFYMPFYVV